MRGRVLLATFLVATSYGAALPFVAARLEETGVSGALLGLNAAMSALGFLLGSLVLPILQVRHATSRILVGALGAAMVVWGAFFFWRDYASWTVLRLALGGAMGLFYRTVEFCLNAATEDDRRTAVFGYYNMAFGGGIAVGAALEPLAGTNEPVLWGATCAGYALAAVAAVHGTPFAAARAEQLSVRHYWRVARFCPLPLVAAFAYGILESIPGYFLPIYALRNGFGDDVSAYSLTAAAIGSIVLPLLFGLGSGRIRQRVILFAAAAGVGMTSVLLPNTLASALAFLATVAVWAGFFATIYTASLAVLGTEHKLDSLAEANSAFGVAYASGGLIGPLLNGAALDAFSPQGLMVTAVVVSAVLTGFCVTPAGRSRCAESA